MLSLGSGCVYVGIVVHEMLHAIGFWHEQSRPDRDQNVAIRWENIQSGKEDNFARYSRYFLCYNYNSCYSYLHVLYIDSIFRGEVSTLDLPYDTKSIMHYEARAFSRNGRPTIVPINEKFTKLGQKTAMTALDIKKLNKLYSCQDHYEKENTTQTCQDALSETTCYSLKINNWCNDFPDYMRDNCVRSCDFCGHNTPEKIARCFDKTSRCSYWSQFGDQCHRDRDFMMRNCPKACGFCRERVEPNHAVLGANVNVISIGLWVVTMIII